MTSINNLTILDEHIDIWFFATAIYEQIDMVEMTECPQDYIAVTNQADDYDEYIVSIKKQHLSELKDIDLSESTDNDFITVYKARVYYGKIEIETFLYGSWIQEFLQGNYNDDQLF